MNQKERQVLKLVEDFRDTLENELASQQKQNKIIKIKDVKFVGNVNTKKSISENLFIVKKKIIEKDETGQERVTEQDSYYLGDECIGGTIGDNQVIYSQDFQTNQPEKAKEVNQLLEETPEKQIEENSLNNLEEKEKDEVLLTQEEQDDIKVNGIQKVDLNKLVDGKETLGKRLDLEEYDNIFVVYSEKVKDITPGSKINNTTYSLVGMTKDGQVKVLNDEFEMDKTVGNNASREQTKIKADGTATRDNNDLSVYTRKSNGTSIGLENNRGNVDMFMYQKTLEENENIGIQIETSKTPIIQIETREIMNRNRGIYQGDKVQDEIEAHVENGCEINDERDFDGLEDTSTHRHLAELDDYVLEIYNYEDEHGEENIKDIFTLEEVKEKFLRELQENKEMSIEEVQQIVKEEMNSDAMMYKREHNM